MDLGLTGKKVIMNGGGHGLGLAALRHFAAEGADVAFLSRDPAKVEAAVREIDAAGPGKVHGTAIDITGDPEGYKGWLNDCLDKLGGCDIFVHTASASGQGATGDW